MYRRAQWQAAYPLIKRVFLDGRMLRSEDTAAGTAASKEPAAFHFPFIQVVGLLRSGGHLFLKINANHVPILINGVTAFITGLRRYVERGRGKDLSRGRAQPSMPGMPGMNDSGGSGNPAWTFIAGFSAAKLGDFATTQKAEAQVSAARSRTEAGGNAYAAKPATIMEKEVAAVAEFAQGQKDALRLSKEAADIEQTMSAPSGPPEPMKPALKLYGDLLMEAGRPKEAAAAYQAQLERTPNRTPSVKGLAAAKSESGTSAAR